MERIEHFCDRCGCKLQEYKRILCFANKDFATRIEVSTDDFLPEHPTVTEIEQKARELAKKEHDYMVIRMLGWKRNRTLELCGKCRKDFDRFMNNE